MLRNFILIILLAGGLQAAAPRYSRVARTWEFLDATGQKASLLGAEDGSIEAYVYPFKIFSALRFSFEVGKRQIPGSAIARRVVFDAGSTTILYTGDEFQVAETLTVPVHEPGGLIQLHITTHEPLTIHCSLSPDFQLMWPGAFGSSFGQWKPDENAFVFGADGKPYAAVLGSPDLRLSSVDYATNYSAQREVKFQLGTVDRSGRRVIAFSGSAKSLDEALAEEGTLLQHADRIESEVNQYYEQYLDQTASVELPDKDLQNTYDRSRLSLIKGLVDNPFLGMGLVAGYGLSKGGYRPGFAWFFGRDSFWSSFALNSEGDTNSSRKAIELVAKFQREDGKIPHEIAQSAAQVEWSKDYPYEYASADATPLFIIAVRDYVQHSGDVKFAAAMWERVRKAMAFSRSTRDAEGFPKNYQVGHGWVEGGPLLPIRVEFYLAGCYVEALRSIAQLAKWTGRVNESRQFEAEAGIQQAKLNRLFWLPNSDTYAFAIGNDSKPVDEPTVLALVPEWWNLLPVDKAQRMIARLSDEDNASDWGMRIISSRSARYNPAGYHFGSVWPLFTGWAAVGEYNAHRAVSAFANLKANSWLALDGAGGNTTEVLSGETYSPLSTATPHQIWSAAMIVAPVLRGLFGLDVDSIAKHVTVRPHLPQDWTTVALNHVVVSGNTLDFEIHQDSTALNLRVQNHGSSTVGLTFAPALSPSTNISRTSVGAKTATFFREDDITDWHPIINGTLQSGTTNITLQYERRFGITLPVEAPQLAETSSNLKLLSQVWENNNKRIRLTLSGRAGHSYEITVIGSDQITRVDGGTLSGGSIGVNMPPGRDYVHSQITIDLR